MVTHGSADNPSLNGTLSCSLCHQDLDFALSQRAQAKVDKFREGYACNAAPGLRHAFLPAIVSSPSPTNRLMRIFNNITIRFNLARTYTQPELSSRRNYSASFSALPRYCRRPFFEHLSLAVSRARAFKPCCLPFRAFKPAVSRARETAAASRRATWHKLRRCTRRRTFQFGKVHDQLAEALRPGPDGKDLVQPELCEDGRRQGLCSLLSGWGSGGVCRVPRVRQVAYHCNRPLGLVFMKKITFRQRRGRQSCSRKWVSPGPPKAATTSALSHDHARSQPEFARVRPSEAARRAFWALGQLADAQVLPLSSLRESV